MTMIVVSGARGNIGSEVVRQLVRRGVPTRALGRDPAKLQFAGAEVARADLLDPETLDTAWQGAERAFVMADATDIPRVAANAVAAAKRTGVRHLVLVSSATVLMHPEPAIGRWHREAEEIVQASGVAWTFLRPGNFASNTLRWAGMIRAQSAVFTPAGGSTAPVDPRDIADVAVAALSEPGHEGQAYVITGPALMTARDQVEILGAALGRPLRFVDVPAAGARAGMLKAGMSEVLADAVLEIMLASSEGRDGMRTDTVQRVTGHAPRTFAQWVSDHLDAFR